MEAEQEKRQELVPRIKAIKEVFVLSKKLRLFFGIYFFFTVFLMVLFSARHLFGLIGAGVMAVVSIYFAKQENDYIKHLSKTYGVN